MNQNYLNSLFKYENGKLFWKTSKAKRIKIGQEAGSHRSKGYFVVGVNGFNYGVHRIIFAMHNGFMPKMIDHIDGNPSNNKIENLRSANHSENGCNKTIQTNNTSGIKGVSWVKSRKRWVAKVQINKKSHQLGYFKDLELAELVAIEGRCKYHGQFARNM
jgi:hypothetical protein